MTLGPGPQWGTCHTPRTEFPRRSSYRPSCRTTEPGVLVPGGDSFDWRAKSPVLGMRNGTGSSGTDWPAPGRGTGVEWRVPRGYRWSRRKTRSLRVWPRQRRSPTTKYTKVSTEIPSIWIFSDPLYVSEVRQVSSESMIPVWRTITGHPRSGTPSFVTGHREQGFLAREKVRQFHVFVFCGLLRLSRVLSWSPVTRLILLFSWFLVFFFFFL